MGLQQWRRLPNVALAVISVALCLDYLLLLAMVPILPIYGVALGLSPTSVGLLFSAKPIAGVLAAPVVGYLSDRVGRRLPMILGLFGSSAFTLLFAFSSTFWQLLVARVLQGVASSTNAAAFAFLADVFPDSKVRGAKMATAIMGISVGVLAGPLFGGLLYEAGGVRLPFLVGSGLLVLDGCGRIFVEEPAKRPAPATRPDPVAVAAAASAEQDVRMQRVDVIADEVFTESAVPAVDAVAERKACTAAHIGMEDVSVSSSCEQTVSVQLGQNCASVNPLAPDVCVTAPSCRRGVVAGAPDVCVTAHVAGAPLPCTCAATASGSPTPPSVEENAVAVDGPVAATQAPMGSVGNAAGNAADTAGIATAVTTAGNKAVSTAAVGFRDIVCNRRVMTLSLALLVGNAAIALMEVVLPLYLSAELQLDAAAIGGLYAGGNALYLLLSRPVALLGARVGRWRVVAAGCVLMGAPMLLMAAVPSLFWVVPLWLVCSGCGMCAIDASCAPELADVADADLPGAHGRVFALSQVCMALGFVAGPLVGTATLQRWPASYTPAFATLGVAVAAFAPAVALGFVGCQCGGCSRRRREDASRAAVSFASPQTN